MCGIPSFRNDFHLIISRFTTESNIFELRSRSVFTILELVSGIVSLTRSVFIIPLAALIGIVPTHIVIIVVCIFIVKSIVITILLIIFSRSILRGRWIIVRYTFSAIVNDIIPINIECITVASISIRSIVSNRILLPSIEIVSSIFLIIVIVILP